MTMYRGSKSFGGEKKSEKSLLQKAVLTFLMTGVVAWPSFSPVYAASDYTRTDGGANVINGKVADIYVGKMSGTTGINKFTNFSVDGSDVANLRFNIKDQSTYANTLINTVENRINIQGTVNAIRDSKIGGHLYFLSPNGMLVGKQGAINTGSLSVLTPTSAWWDNKFNGNVTQELVSAVSAMAVPINASGSFIATKTAEGTKGSVYVKTNGDVNGQNGDIYHYGHKGTIIMQNGQTEITEVYGEGDLMSYEMVKAEGEIKYEARNKAFLMTDMIATDDINMTFDEGAAIAEEITCVDGGVTIETKGQSSSGNLVVSAKISAGGAVNLISAGNLTIDKVAGGGSGIIAKDDIVLNAEKNIVIQDASNIQTTAGGLEVQSNKGGIEVNGPVTAKGFVRLYTKGNSTDERAINYDEPYNTDTDNLQPQTKKLMKKMLLGASEPEIREGDIVVTDNIITDGDVDLSTFDGKIETKNITAGEMAVVGTSGGTINIDGTIKGKDVTLYSENTGVNVQFGKIDVANKLILAGNEWDLNKNNLKTDADGFDLYVYSAVDKNGKVNPTSSVKINYSGLPGSTTGDVHIGNLTAGNIVLYTDGPLVIDSLSVSDRAELHVMGTQTDIYGVMHPYDANADMIYYQQGNDALFINLAPVLFGYDVNYKHEQVNQLAVDHMGFLLDKNGEKVTDENLPNGFRFEQLIKDTQTYAGILLERKRGYKSYLERFSVDEIMGWNLAQTAIGGFNNQFNNNIQFFNRFDNVAIPAVVVNQPEEWDKDKFEF